MQINRGSPGFTFSYGQQPGAHVTCLHRGALRSAFCWKSCGAEGGKIECSLHRIATNDLCPNVATYMLKHCPRIRWPRDSQAGSFTVYTTRLLQQRSARTNISRWVAPNNAALHVTIAQRTLFMLACVGRGDEHWAGCRRSACTSELAGSSSRRCCGVRCISWGILPCRCPPA